MRFFMANDIPKLANDCIAALSKRVLDLSDLIIADAAGIKLATSELTKLLHQVSGSKWLPGSGRPEGDLWDAQQKLFRAMIEAATSKEALISAYAMITDISAMTRKLRLPDEEDCSC